MLSLRFMPIRRKLTLITMVTSVTALFLSLASFYLTEAQSFRLYTAQRVSSIADLLSYNTVAALSFSDNKTAAENLQALQAAPHIEATVIYNSVGEVFASYQRPDIAAPLVPPAVQRDVKKFAADHLEIFQSIHHEGDFLGTLYLRYDMAELDEQRASLLRMSVAILLVSSLLALLLATRLQKVISDPILHLALVIDRISRSGDYSVRVSSESRDEIGLLYHGFNAMLDQIHKRETERDQALADLEATNELLKESEEMRIRAIVDTAAEGIITFGEDGLIQTFNRSAEKIFGFSAQEAIGTEIVRMLPESDTMLQERNQALTSGVYHGVGTGWGGETVGRRRDDRTFPMEFAMSVVQVADKNLSTLIVRDITERKNMESELLQARKLEAIGQLAAGIAHEINTPIQYVGNNVTFLRNEFSGLQELLTKYSELLNAAKDGGITPEQLDETEALVRQIDVDYLKDEIPKAIAEATEGIQRVANIVRSMKEFSHPGTAEKQALDLNRAIEVTVTVARNEWRYVSDVSLDLDPAMPLILCYPGDINQAILNLIVNAAHAIEVVVDENSDEKGKITIATRVANGMAEIRVSDSGCGITRDVQERMFDPFFTTKEVGKGTGQGLAIVRSVVVEKHRGTISYETEVGKGTTFIIHLPIS